MLIKVVNTNHQPTPIPVKCKKCSRQLKASCRHEVCNRCRKR